MVSPSTAAICFGASNSKKVVNVALLKPDVPTANLSSSDLDKDDNNTCPDNSVDPCPVSVGSVAG